MGDVLVLCYHAVSRSWPAPLSVLPERLEEQLRLLTSRGYRGATFTEAVTAPPHERTLAVTFDDAFRLHAGARPAGARAARAAGYRVRALRLRGQRPADRVGGHGALGGHRTRARAALHDHRRAVRAAGRRAGRSARTPARIPGCPRVDDTRLDEELRRSKAVLEDKLGAPCTSIAYPYGAVDERVADAAAAAGYAAGAALATPRGAPRPHRWPRVASYHTDSLGRFRRKVSPLVRRLRLAQTRTALRSALGR